MRNIKSGNPFLLILGLAGAAALTAGTAAADTFVPLPDGHDHFTMADGATVTLDRTGEHATVCASMAASPLSRNVWVSGVATARIEGPARIGIQGGTIETGYLLGCQVDLGNGLAVGQGDGDGTKPDPSTTLRLAPGKVVTVPLNSFDFTGNSGTTEYVDKTLAIEGCAGYAQARAYTTVTVHDVVMDDSQTLWGAPFSIG
ncbi:MspA family porin [Nocardia sp. NPDC058058]|uniref:MspA family porin n=1 Tax=Nocardia sp. NPDC058058 TaxID=3346317 RepID=UPI0036DE485E